MKKNAFVLVCCCLLLSACANKSQTPAQTTTEAAVDMHTAANSLDVTGVYTGTFPAADCPGIEVKYTFNADNTYTSYWVYIDRPGCDIDEKGTYVIEQNILTLDIEGGSQPEYYKVAENKLIRLDADKREIEGDMAPYYILTKE